MERLIVDAEGKVVIPPEVIHKRGLRPGDVLTLVEAEEGMLVYKGGTDPETQAWWQSLGEHAQQQAKAEARRYEALSEAERDALWNEDAESLEVEAEGDESELPVNERSSR